MTAFELFQIATCQIGEGDRTGAAASLKQAIEQIDCDGVDADLRPDLVSLRLSILRNTMEARGYVFEKDGR